MLKQLLRSLGSTALVLAHFAYAQTLPETQVGDAPTNPPAESSPPNVLQGVEDKVGFLQGKLESLEEQYAETKHSVLTFSKLKFAGYVQARYQYAENSLGGLDATGAPLVKDGFSVRRGRLKAQYQGDWASFLLQLDATPTGVSLKDAEAALKEPWSGLGITLTAGQTKWPFGYEIVQSSGDREFPERTRMVRAFGNGERDRGAKLAVKAKWLRATVGVFDGNGTANTKFIGVDNDTEKDVVGRVGADFKWLAFGVSGWAGKSYRPSDYTATPAIVGKFFARNRIGFDAQVYLDLFPFGGTSLKGEFIAGTTYQASGVERHGQTALGWYLLLVQNIGDHEQLAVRYDFFNPATGTPGRVDSKNPNLPASTNQVHTIGVLVTHYFDDVFKASAVYEIPLVEPGGPDAVTPKQNLFTLQFQAKF